MANRSVMGANLSLEDSELRGVYYTEELHLEQ